MKFWGRHWIPSFHWIDLFHLPRGKSCVDLLLIRAKTTFPINLCTLDVLIAWRWWGDSRRTFHPTRVKGCLLAAELKAYLTFIIFVNRFASTCPTAACMLWPFPLLKAVLITLIAISERRLWTLKVPKLVYLVTWRGGPHAVSCALGLVRFTIIWSRRVDLFEDCVTSCVGLHVELHVVLAAFDATHHTDRAVTELLVLTLHLLFLIDDDDTTLRHCTLVGLVS